MPLIAVARRPTARLLVSAVSVVTVGVLPSFLTGALGVQLADDLGFGIGSLGVAAGAFFVTGAATSVVMGRVVERTGANTALRAGAAVSAAALLLVATTARSLAGLTACLAVAGLGNSLSQPAANLWIARAIPARRLGLSLGVKQSAIPAAGLLAGLAVPAFALTVGWRWAYVVGAALAVMASATVPSTRLPTSLADPADPPSSAPRDAMVVLTVGIAFGAAVAGSIATFLVASAVHAGVSEGAAGLLLTGGSAVGMAVRLLVGARADRRGRRHLPVVAAMLAGGSAAYVLFALGEPALFVVGTPLAFGAGWAWPGLFHLAVVRANQAAPGAATGFVQTGTYVGAVVGPLAFGAIAETAGFGPAWLAAGASSLVAAASVVVGRRLLVRAVSPTSSASTGP